MNKVSLSKTFASFVLFAKGEQDINDMRRFSRRTKALTPTALIGLTVAELAAYSWRECQLPTLCFKAPSATTEMVTSSTPLPAFCSCWHLV